MTAIEVDRGAFVHTRLADQLTHSMAVGGTHWDHEADAPPGDLPGSEPTFFFAPSQIAKRSKEWGRAGAEAVTAAYQELLAGHADPRHGQICSLAGSD